MESATAHGELWRDFIKKEETEMKKQLLTVALLLATNAVLQAEDGGMAQTTDFERGGFGGGKGSTLVGTEEAGSEYDEFVMQLAKAGQEKLLTVLEERYVALTADLKRIEDSHNKTISTPATKEAFHEKVMEQHDCLALIRMLKKEQYPAGYMMFLRTHAAFLFLLLDSSSESVRHPARGRHLTPAEEKELQEAETGSTKLENAGDTSSKAYQGDILELQELGAFDR